MRGLAAVCFSLFAACQSPTEAPVMHPLETAARKTDSSPAATRVFEPTDTTTLGGTWYLQAVLPSDTATGRSPMLQFDLPKSHFAGNTGCNSMSGTFYYSSTDSSLSFNARIVRTRMACPGYNEAAFMKSLQSTSRYRLRHGMLTLLGDDNAELSQWARKPGTGPRALKT
jgi:heat shock protein HslJ